MNKTQQHIWNLLHEVKDPEIPVIDIIELGIVRNLVVTPENKVVVDISPTYTGCPAMKVIEDDILKVFSENGINDVKINTVLRPAWTTDWITDEAKEKLRAYGIAPPEHTSADKNSLLGKPKIVSCPNCKSQNTTMISQFGSTACKALYKCDSCQEPFDYFKCI